MRIIKINPQNPSLEAIKIAAEVIRKGGVIIYPTDTIYGIGANALSREAVDKIYKIKERSERKPLSVIASGIKMAKKYCTFSKKQEDIFKAVLPGPFSLILPVKSLRRAKVLTSYKKTLSLRVPDSKVTSFLAKELKIPLTATSANISGLSGSGDIKAVLKQLENKKNQIDLVLDAGILPKKNPSVIIDLTGEKPKIIRK